MKRGAMLINTGWGVTLSPTDALEGLRRGQLGYLGINVYEHESGLFFEDRSELVNSDSLIDELVTNHQTFLTQAVLRPSLANRCRS